tara:strand:+ start:83 stop:454 length:372 start_codon:yes stop_codon:yes gene_type:complete
MNDRPANKLPLSDVISSGTNSTDGNPGVQVVDDRGIHCNITGTPYLMKKLMVAISQSLSAKAALEDPDKLNATLADSLSVLPIHGEQHFVVRSMVAGGKHPIDIAVTPAMLKQLGAEIKKLVG